MLVNVCVIDKKLVLENEKIKEIICVVEEEMNGDGCIFVCLFGIELFICVMVEVLI